MPVHFYIIAAIGLGLLVVLHEGGHFLAARLCGMRVERFSIGFGPMLFGFKRGGTIFQIAPIPLGGFVQITGLNPHEEFDHNDPYVYPNRPRWMRLFVVVAGPLANFITATIVMLFVYGIHGAPTFTSERVSEVTANSAAAEVGIVAGDVITHVNGEAISEERTVRSQVKRTAGAPLQVKLLRKGQPMDISVTPKRQPDGDLLIGVRFEHDVVVQSLPFGGAAKMALRYPYEKSKVILFMLRETITGKEPLRLSGPIGIAKDIARAARDGVWEYLGFIAMLSVYLGLFNLLPLPALDGGRAVFLLAEAAVRRKINPRFEAAVHMVGIVMLIGVLLIVSMNDIRGK